MSFSNLIPAMPEQPALSRNVVEVLKGMIGRGTLAQGAHLKETEIAAALGVSRGPVREAFAQLATEGYVELRRHKGAYVRTLTRRDIEEVYSLRLALERLAVTRACTLMTSEQLDEMDEVLSRMAGVSEDYSPQDAVVLDLAFHDIIYAAAGHQRLDQAWLSLRSQVEFFLNARNISHRDFLEVGHAEHKLIRDVLAAGDPATASAAIEDHLNGAYHRLLEDQATQESTREHVPTPSEASRSQTISGAPSQGITAHGAGD
jgi:DNA-binding GntR family transcriptional regulator